MALSVRTASGSQPTSLPEAMAVTEVDTLHLVLPLDEVVLRGRVVEPKFTIHIIVVRVRVGDVVGIGYAWDPLPGRAKAIRVIAEELGAGVVGEDAREIRRLWQKSWKNISAWGQHHGVGLAALSAIDVALWDALGKRAGMPLHHMWGATGSELPVYITGGPIALSPEELAEEGLAYRDRGHSAFKVQVGNADWRQDVRRISKLRQALGDDFDILVDAHMLWDRRTSRLAAGGFSELGVCWFEDPLQPQDLEGYAELRRATDVPIVHGEHVFARHGILDIVRAQAADYILIDVMHCGGPTEMLQAAAIAAAHYVPISSHSFHAVAGHIMAACDNCNFVEYQERFTIFDGEPQLRNGKIQISDQPGFGLDLPEETIERYSIKE